MQAARESTSLLDVLEQVCAGEAGRTFWDALRPTHRRTFMSISRRASQLAKQHLITRLKATVSQLLLRAPALLEGYDRLRSLELHLAYAGAVEWAFVPEPLAEVVSKLLLSNNLEKLRLHACSKATAADFADAAKPVLTDALLSTVLLGCGKLQQLCISGFEGTFGPSPLAPLHRCAQLTSLELNLERVPAAAIDTLPLLPMLQVLTISETCTAPITLNLAEKVPNLTTLSIGACPGMDMEGLAPCVSGLTRLTSLKLLGRWVSHDNVNALAAVLPNLRDLTVQSGTLYLEGDDSLRHLTSLESLALGGAFVVQGATAPSLPTVTSLAFTHQNTISAVHLQKVLAAFPNLQQLLLSLPLYNAVWEAEHLQSIRAATAHIERLYLVCYPRLVRQPSGRLFQLGMVEEDLVRLADWRNVRGVAMDLAVVTYPDAALAAMQYYLAHVPLIMLGPQLSGLPRMQLFSLCHEPAGLQTLILDTPSIEHAVLVPLWCHNVVRPHPLTLCVPGWPEEMVQELNLHLQASRRMDLRLDRGGWFVNMVKLILEDDA